MCNVRLSVEAHLDGPTSRPGQHSPAVKSYLAYVAVGILVVIFIFFALDRLFPVTP